MNNISTTTVRIAILLHLSLGLLGCGRSPTEKPANVSGPQILVVIQSDGHSAVHAISQQLKTTYKESSTGKKGDVSAEFEGGKISTTLNGGTATVKTDFDCIVYIEKLKRTVRVQKEKTFAIK